jgi:hypothetical protein
LEVGSLDLVRVDTTGSLELACLVQEFSSPGTLEQGEVD